MAQITSLSAEETSRHNITQRVTTSNIVFVGDDDDIQRALRGNGDGVSHSRAVERCQGSVRDRYPFLHASAGTTFIQPHHLMRRSSEGPGGSPTTQPANATIHTIEHAEGAWRSVPGCVRDTIVRLLRSAKDTARRETADRKAMDSVAGPPRRSASAATPRPSSTASTTKVSRITPSRRPLSARGATQPKSSAPSAAASAVQGPQLGRRVSFIASDGLPTRRRSSSSGAVLDAGASKFTGTSTSLSSTVARVLSTSPGRLQPATLSPPHDAPAQRATPSPGRHVSPLNSCSPAKDLSPDGLHGCNVPFGQHSAQHHPYYDDDHRRNPVPPTDPFAPHHGAVPRRSPTRGTAHRPGAVSPVAHSAPWRPTGVVQPYEPTEPFGTMGDDVHRRSGGGGAARSTAHGRKLRSLATSNLMTFHHGIERMHSDHERFLQGQLFAAMQQSHRSHAPPTAAATEAKRREMPAASGGVRAGGGSTTAVPSNSDNPTAAQRNALENVSRLLKALHNASVELVAEFLTDEEKRYLGVHSHKYQTKQERETRYQYTHCSFKATDEVNNADEAGSKKAEERNVAHVDRMLRLSDDDATALGVAQQPKPASAPVQLKPRGVDAVVEKRPVEAPATKRVPYYQFVDEQLSALHEADVARTPPNQTGAAPDTLVVEAPAQVRTPTTAVPPLRLPNKILLSPNKGMVVPSTAADAHHDAPAVPLRHNSSGVANRVAAAVNAILSTNTTATATATPEAPTNTTDNATTDTSVDHAGTSRTTATSDDTSDTRTASLAPGASTKPQGSDVGVRNTATTTTSAPCATTHRPTVPANRTVASVKVAQPQTVGGGIKRPVALHKPIATATPVAAPPAPVSGKQELGKPSATATTTTVTHSRATVHKVPVQQGHSSDSALLETRIGTSTATVASASTARDTSPDLLQPPSARGVSVASHETATSATTSVNTVSIGRRVIDLSQFKVHDSDDDSDDS